MILRRRTSTMTLAGSAADWEGLLLDIGGELVVARKAVGPNTLAVSRPTWFWYRRRAVVMRIRALRNRYRWWREELGEAYELFEAEEDK